MCKDVGAMTGAIPTSRRRFLWLVGAGSLGAALAACDGSTAPASSAPPASSSAAASTAAASAKPAASGASASAKPAASAGTATLKVTVPAGAASQGYADVFVLSARGPDDVNFWPLALTVR